MPRPFSLLTLTSPFPRGHAWRAAGLASLIACTTGCQPPAESGQCNTDDDCPVRGQVCEEVTHECIEDDVDYDATQDEPEATFTGKHMPFFRGRVCTVQGEFQAGAALPIRMEPCLHPCMTASNGDAHMFNLRECRSGICNGFSTEWFMADGVDCPADAFGRFDATTCQYPISIDGRHSPFEANGSPIVGRFKLEIPFLTNDDAAQIATFTIDGASEACVDDCLGNDNPDSCHKACFIRERAESYVQQDERVLSFDMRTDAAAPPPDCEQDQAGCPCVDIGF